MRLYTHRVLIGVATIVLAIQGFLGLTFGVLELAANFTLRVLLKNSTSSNSTVEDSGSTSGAIFLDSLDKEVIEQVVTGVVDIYKALIICCVSCCDLLRILRIMCGILGMFVALSVVNIYVSFERRAALKEVVDELESNFLTNFYNLYRDTHGSETQARFTFEMNSVQGLFKCCGVNSYLEYANASLWKAGPGQNLTVPPTCCRLERKPFLYINCIIFLQGACMYDPTLDNSYIGQGCFQVIQTVFRAKFLKNLVWNISSLLMYVIILFLFVIQLRIGAQAKEDPFEGLRDGGFLKAMQQIVEEMEVVDENSERDSKGNSKTCDDDTQNLIGNLGTFIDVVMYAATKKST